MTTANPQGHPLSGPAKKGAVTFRPRRGGKGGKRQRLRVPTDVARDLEADQKETVRARRDKAAAAAGERKAATQAEREAKRKAPKKRAKKERAPKAKKERTPKAKKERTPKAKKERTPRRRPPTSPALPPAAAAEVAAVCAQAATQATRRSRKKDTGQQDLFARINPSKRAPVRLDDLRVAVELGDLAELVWDTDDGYRQRMKPARNLRLLWSAEADALFFFAAETRRRAAEDVPDSRERQIRQRWQGAASTGAYTLLTKLDAAPWKKIGDGHAITYRSDKRGRREEHEHDFEAGVKVYNKGSLWVVCGGKLRVTRRGLEG